MSLRVILTDLFLLSFVSLFYFAQATENILFSWIIGGLLFILVSSSYCFNRKKRVIEKSKSYFESEVIDKQSKYKNEFLISLNFLCLMVLNKVIEYLIYYFFSNEAIKLFSFSPFIFIFAVMTFILFMQYAIGVEQVKE